MWGRLGARSQELGPPGLPAAATGLALRLAGWALAHAVIDQSLRAVTGHGLLDLVDPGPLALGEVVYVAAATLIDPEPDLDDLGLGRGIDDDPTRLSDNWNRGLLDLSVLLVVTGGPGRWLGVAFVRVFSALLHGRRRPSLPDLRPPPPDTRRPIDRANRDRR
ncbi:MAG TPA: hypothetical protein PKA64_10970 [Myxococcota bacterium]|nr:hypothetical protein [Myxococcota bacterium]